MITDEYKVRWKNTWLPRSELGNARRLVRKSDTKQPVLHRVKRVAEHHLTDIQVKPGDLAENPPKPLQTNEHSGCAAQVQESLADPARSSLGSDFGSNQVGHWSSIGIRADLENISECSRSYNCSCHIGRRLKSPGLLDGFLGTLFIRYSGSPLLSQRCDQVSCRGRRDSSTSFIYQCPR